MATTSLLERMTGTSSPYGPLLVPLSELFTGFARSYWVRGIPVRNHPQTPSGCKVVAPDQVAAYCLTGNEGWAEYREIQAAFEARDHEQKRRAEAAGTKRTGAKTSWLPKELVFTGTRLILRDTDSPIECVVSIEAVYPRRAWVAALHPGVGTEMPYVLAGMLNSTLGLVLYRRLARSNNRSSHDLRKGDLGRLKIPFLNYDAEVFHRAALLSYRLHCLCTAGKELMLPAWVEDEDIPNHRMRLLSELARLYGFNDQEARSLVEEVLPAGAADVLGAQGKLFYRPKEPLQPIRLHTPEMLEQYERLKEHARKQSLKPEEQRDLTQLQALLKWEHLANSPIPSPMRAKQVEGAFTAEAALRQANRYLSEAKGQSVLAQDARRISSQLWEVQLKRSARPTRKEESTRPESGSKELPISRLWVNAITGAVSDKPEKARDGATSGA